MNIRNLSDHIERIFHILIAENPRQQNYHVDAESDIALTRLFFLLRSFKTADEDAEFTPENLIALIEFLASRWEIIKNSNLAYPHQPRSVANIICLLLAQELETLSGISRYQLLMPTITIGCNEISSTEIKENGLELHEFVLSDNNDRIIDIIPCLDFAMEDGVLKHTSLFDGKAKVLSRTEAERVINHSAHSKKYYDAISERVEARTKSSSFGAVLTRFAESLRSGGNHGSYRGGEELNAGHNANEGIVYFAEWLSTLSNTERANLFSRKISDGGKTFADLWGRAARPTDANYQSTTYCVALIADDVDLILRSNPNLFDIYPINNEAAKIKFFAPLESNVSNRKKEFVKALRGNNYIVTASYSDQQNTEQASRFAEQFPQHLRHFTQAVSRLEKNLADHFLQRFKTWISEYYTDTQMFFAALHRMPDAECITLLELINERERQPFMVENLSEFAMMYSNTPDSYRPVLLRQFHSWLFHGIHRAEELRQTLEYFPENERMQTMLDSPLDVAAVVRTFNDFRMMIGLMPQNHRIAALMLDTRLISLIKTGEQLAQIFSLLDSEDRMKIILEIAPSLKRIIKSGNDLLACLDALFEKDQGMFISTLGENLNDIVLEKNTLTQIEKKLSQDNLLLFQDLYKPDTHPETDFIIMEHDDRSSSESSQGSTESKKHNAGILSLFNKMLPNSYRQDDRNRNNNEITREINNRL